MEHQKPLIGAYLLLIKDNKVLMEKRLGGVLDGKYTLVSGHTEEGETVIDAIVREAEEEANITLNPKELQVKVVVQRPQSYYKGTPTDIIDFFIYAPSFSGDIHNNEPDKCSELIFQPIDNLPVTTMPHVKKALEAFFNGETFLIS